MACQLVSLSISIFISLLVIGFIYVFSWNHHRSTKEAVILRAIGIVFAIFVSIVILLLTNYIDYENLTPTLSLSPYYLFESIVIPICLTIILFIGPIIDRFQQGTLFLALDPDEELPPFYSFARNYLLGPILEEYFYRFLLTTLLIQCFSQSSTILISSAIFSISHAHHHIKGLINGGETLEWVNFICHLIQTFIFACYACCIYLRAQSVISVILIHSFCNWMGPPRFDRLFSQRYLAIISCLGIITCITLLSIYLVS
ncbi:CAAX prenyl protease 2-like [Panonychus citri]|uniref:CAAX prenyl protease 2-like n=1 Tax=Panonychus citri TaxID=50023 RepID=UPI00230701F9|nr:CAAX prenyl protease 2-like [Panonychus citri]